MSLPRRGLPLLLAVVIATFPLLRVVCEPECAPSAQSQTAAANHCRQHEGVPAPPFDPTRNDGCRHSHRADETTVVRATQVTIVMAFAALVPATFTLAISAETQSNANPERPRGRPQVTSLRPLRI